MRFHALFYATVFVHTVFAAVLNSPVDVSHDLDDKRALGNILGGWNPTGQDATQAQDVPLPTHTTDAVAHTDSTASILGLPLAGGEQTVKTIPQTTSTAAGTSYSVIGTIPPVPTPTPHPPLSSTAAFMPSPSDSDYSTSDGQAPSSGGTSEWKIIGVAVIAFSAVAAILLASVFFDHWWRFVRDLVWRRRARENAEELVPDWEKGTWELRVGEDRQRYPSFSSLPSTSGTIVQGQTQGREQLQRPLGGAGERLSEARSYCGVGARPQGSVSPRGEHAEMSGAVRKTPPGLYTRPGAGGASNLDRTMTPNLADAYGGIDE